MLDLFIADQRNHPVWPSYILSIIVYEKYANKVKPFLKYPLREFFGIKKKEKPLQNMLETNLIKYLLDDLVSRRTFYDTHPLHR